MKKYLQTFLTIILTVTLNAQQLNGVYVLSEGGFSSGTSMLSKLSLPSSQFAQNIFSPGNIGLYPDGIKINKGYIYLVEQGNFGGAGKIYKLNTDGSVVNSQEVGTNPYSLTISNGKVYLTNGLTSSVLVINKNDFSFVKEIIVGVYPQEITSFDGNVFVANNSLWGGDSDSTITVISSATDEVISTITVRADPSSLAISNDNHLLIGCPGIGVKGVIFKVELDTFTKVDSFAVSEYGFGKDINIDKNNEKIYFKSSTNQIVALDLMTGELVLTISDPTILFVYGYAYDYLSGNHYLTDAKDFAANGSLKVYNRDGEILNSYETSTAPRRIVFDYDENTVSVAIENLASNFNLEQNYPNPFNPTTTINYSVPKVDANLSSAGTISKVKLAIYDVLGKKVANLVSQQQNPGDYSVQFDASKLSSGIYYYKLQAGNYVQTKKMVLLQ